MTEEKVSEQCNKDSNLNQLLIICDSDGRIVFSHGDTQIFDSSISELLGTKFCELAFIYASRIEMAQKLKLKNLRQSAVVKMDLHVIKSQKCSCCKLEVNNLKMSTQMLSNIKWNHFLRNLSVQVQQIYAQFDSVQIITNQQVRDAISSKQRLFLFQIEQKPMQTKISSERLIIDYLQSRKTMYFGEDPLYQTPKKQQVWKEQPISMIKVYDRHKQK